MFPFQISHHFADALPKDPIDENYTRQVGNVAFSRVEPVKFPKARLLHVSNFANDLGFDEAFINSKEFQEIFTGQKIPSEAQPYAMAYAGHQFGHWAGQLGDGRAINLFEANSENKNWTYQLKGAGPTPYSRRGDGFAVLRSSIREHLCSEAMHHLGIATTRSLSLSLTGEKILRDMLYDGNPEFEPGAIVCRVAESFVRFGNFQHFAAQGENESLKKLTDHIILHHYPKIAESPNKYMEFFSAVCDRTLKMIIDWQRVGFVHGVMNTDNMSILGLTIDYGPYGWLEPYELDWTPNTTDRNGRYTFGQQPEIALWNLLQLANALYPLIEDSKPLEARLMQYKTDYFNSYHTMMSDKLGLFNEKNQDQKLIADLESTLQLHECDMTLFFRELSKIDQDSSVQDCWNTLQIAFYNYDQLQETHRDQLENWFQTYLDRLKVESVGYDGDDLTFAKARTQKMNATNPKYVLRNYIAQLVITEAEKENYELLNEVYAMLKNPYDEQPEYEKWYQKRPEWARSKVGCSQLSCSS
ncbi:hypothetical protein BST97_05170 [Nonlabens spongiae]|uniref:Protein nucleotidyltransferase YdiU n=1 Tax=Nonlabens spongiae TaxID=331648 RepID=A0A1W6MIK4_9FLAO|nr:YdiU family protein [Nonlabens spongiae]ARN77422.1 hypothetical protein BST97_05170 [Nonlabens spongiae]